MASNGSDQTITSTAPASPDASYPKRKHPCILCQQRKVKCDRAVPCANCTKARVECVSPTTLPPKRRKKRFPEAELLARLKRYEDHLRRYGADIDAINAEGTTSAPLPSERNASTGSNITTSPVTAESLPHPMRSLSIRRSLKKVKCDMWAGAPQEFQDAEDLLQGSSEDEMYETPITKTYDSLLETGGDFLFPSPASDTTRDYHPSAVQAFRLWQTFIDNVNPLMKIFHAPTVQQQFLDAVGDLENVPKDVEALMFGIYSTATMSLSESDALDIFGETKVNMRTRYQAAARLALHRAGLLRSSDITLLQAFVLYLYSCLNFSMDPRSLFCLTGIAVRIAQRMGLHYDGTSYGVPPFDVEMRRRLWWQIILLDFRVAALSGAGTTILTHVWTTKLPSNVNDSDLFPGMKEPPSENPGRISEMIFVLQACEVANTLQELKEVGDSLDSKDKLIEELSKRLESRYIQYCDPSIPLHLLSSVMARSGVLKLMVMSRHPHLISSKGLSTDEKDKLFMLSVKLLENHNRLIKAKSVSRFLWHILSNFPFPAHVYLLIALRTRTSGEFSDRGWAVVEESCILRGQMWEKSEVHKLHHKNSAMHLALCNLMLKAWEAKQKEQPGLPSPPFIIAVQETIAAKKAARTASEPVTPPIDNVDTVFDTQFMDGFQWDQNDMGMGLGMNMSPNMGMGVGFQAYGQGIMAGIIPVDNNAQNSWPIWNDLMQMPVQTPMASDGNSWNGMQSN